MYSYSSWEMGQIINRQSAELAESRRQIEEIRARLQELGRRPEDGRVTVEQPAAEGAPSGPIAAGDGGEPT
jgi:hypothetical protein